MPVPDRSPDLVVLSHLRWAFVWQRPQHLVTRLTRARAGTGSRTWFVEEPVVTPEVDAPQLHQEQHGDVVRVQLRLPAGDGPAADRLDFTDPRAARYADLVAGLVGGGTTPDVWLYTPMALDIAEALEPGLVVYDVMDDLAAFALAPDGMRLRQRRALRTADVVLAGGRSLHAGVTPHRGDAHLFPSGVETDHYARSRSLRRPHDRPVAGFVGVLDERLDRDLVAGLAAALPDWDVHVVGPVVEFKLDPALLPQAPNIHYTGQQRYEDLPAVMAGFDVAIMPFALNEATRSISPTKTLEFLAAGLPVVSTPVPDVVADFGAVVHVASGVEEFAAACRSVLTDAVTERDRKMRGIEPRYEWDAIARSVHDIVEAARADRSHVRSQGRSASTGVTA